MENKLDRIKDFADKVYRPPKSVDPTDIHDLDEIKLHELREVRRTRDYMMRVCSRHTQQSGSN